MEQKIRTLIVDDEELGRERVRVSLGEDPEIEVVGECASGPEAIAAINTLAPHLVFLDVVMPVTDGFAVLEAVEKEKMPLVIFVTAHRDFAVKAFDVHALDYLLKPYDDLRFRDALRQAKDRLRTEERGEISARTLALLEEIKSARRYLERLPVKVKDRVRFVKVSQIDWIEAQDKYVCLHVGAASYLLHESISKLAEQLDPERFPLINRSYIVNVESVKHFKRVFHDPYVVLQDDKTELKVSRSGLARLERIFRRKL